MGPINDTLSEDDAVRTARFHALLQEGLDDLDRGDVIEVTDITAWLVTLNPSHE